MNNIIWLAKSAMVFVWVVLFTNMIMPFPGKASIALYILTAFLFCMHGLQLLMFIGAFGEKIKLTTQEKFSVCFFGVFALFSIRKKYLTTND